MIRTDGIQTIANAPKRLTYSDLISYSVLIEVMPDGSRVARRREAWASVSPAAIVNAMDSLYRHTGNRIEQRVGRLGNERLHRFIEQATGERCRMDDSGVPATEGWVR